MAKHKDDFPLRLHATGRYYRKIGTKFHYFGRDRDAALDQWTRDKDYLLAGKTPPRKDDNPTIVELGNLFIDRCKRRVADGELSKRSVLDYQKTIERLVELLGKHCKPSNMAPMDFADLRDQLAEPIKRTTAIQGGIKGRTVTKRSAITVTNDIRRIKAFLTWCHKTELIPAPRFGMEFKPASAKVVRRQRAKVGPRDLSATDIRAILDKASLQLRPLVLLGINAGIGNLDLSEMRFKDIPADLSKSDLFVDLPRTKTGADRRFWLWPETAAAIASYLAKRASPAGRTIEDRLFLTRMGLPWVRFDGDGRTDSIGTGFVSARVRAGVEAGTFYDLRRTFQTVAAESTDFPAVKLIMGHTPHATDMSATYTQRISDERIKKVCQHVRSWLFGEVSE